MTSRVELGRTAADAFRTIDRSGNGFLEPGEIMTLLKSLNPSRSWTKNDVLFVLKSVDTTRDGRISLKEFKRWWEAHELGHDGAKFNKLLVKDMVGAVRTSTYKLPPQEYRYGMKVPSDMHGAKEILGEWVAENKKKPGSKASGPDHTVEIHGHKNRPSTPISELIRFDFAGEAGKARDKPYPDTKRRAAAKIPPRETAATMGRVTAVRGRTTAAESKGTWKMKKFNNARSRISTQPGKVSIPGKSTGIYAGLQGGGAQGRSRGAVAQAGRVISSNSADVAVIHGSKPGPSRGSGGPKGPEYYERLPEGAIVSSLPPGAHVVDA